MKQQLSRRRFLHLSGAAAVGTAVLAACQQAVPEGSEEMSEAQPAAERIQIEFLGMPGSPDLIPEEQELFHDENPDIEWVLVQQAEGVQSNLGVRYTDRTG